VPGRVSAALVAVLLVLGVLAWLVDGHRRTQEDHDLAACRAALASTAQGAGERMGAMAEYLRPTLSTVRGAKARALADLMRAPARHAIPPLRAARGSCRKVEVWPWHAATASTRRATLAYADALLDRLDRVSASGAVWFEPGDRVDRLRARAGLSPP
jgi:hypothetical protein